MDEINEKPKQEDDIGIPVVPLVLGGMMATGPLTGAGLLPFIGGNLFKDNGDKSTESDKDDEDEEDLRR